MLQLRVIFLKDQASGRFLRISREVQGAPREDKYVCLGTLRFRSPALAVLACCHVLPADEDQLIVSLSFDASHTEFVFVTCYGVARDCLQGDVVEVKISDLRYRNLDTNSALFDMDADDDDQLRSKILFKKEPGGEGPGGQVGDGGAEGPHVGGGDGGGLLDIIASAGNEDNAKRRRRDGEGVVARRRARRLRGAGPDDGGPPDPEVAFEAGVDSGSSEGESKGASEGESERDEKHGLHPDVEFEAPDPEARAEVPHPPEAAALAGPPGAEALAHPPGAEALDAPGD